MASLKIAAVALICAAIGGGSIIALSGTAAQPPGMTSAPMGEGGIPQGMVAFFELPNCPPGWRPVQRAWQGRYFVAAQDSIGTMVGTALTPGENRPTGEHGHAGSVAFYGGDCGRRCGQWARAEGFNRQPVMTTTTIPTRPGDTIQPGTNAPYVTLRTCTKR